MARQSPAFTVRGVGFEISRERRLGAPVALALFFALGEHSGVLGLLCIGQNLSNLPHLLVLNGFELRPVLVNQLVVTLSGFVQNRSQAGYLVVGELKLFAHFRDIAAAELLGIPGIEAGV